LDKTISLQLNKGRKVQGVLRGYDQFMNIVLGNAVEEASNSNRSNIGMVVSFGFFL
jgi:small nuclear ribonucleoprotein G